MSKAALPPVVDLTVEEAALANEVREANRLLLVNHDYERTINAGYASRRLIESLMKRQAIPEHRIRYFTDPSYNSGQRKGSRAEVFRRNAGSNGEMYEHPHFWKYLLYFIDGPQLPAELLTRIATLCADEMRDHGSVEKLARQTCRALTGDTEHLSEEYFKSVVECGGTLTEAQNVRRAVRAARRS